MSHIKPVLSANNSMGPSLPVERARCHVRVYIFRGTFTFTRNSLRRTSVCVRRVQAAMVSQGSHSMQRNIRKTTYRRKRGRQGGTTCR